MCYVSAENIIHAISEFCRLVQAPVRPRTGSEANWSVCKTLVLFSIFKKIGMV